MGIFYRYIKAEKIANNTFKQIFGGKIMGDNAIFVYASVPAEELVYQILDDGKADSYVFVAPEVIE